MKKDKAGSRKRAEKELPSNKETLHKMSDREIRGLVQELRVHQIELETQNEELRQAQEALEKSRQRYATLFDFAPIGYFTCDESGKIREANLTIAEQLSVQKIRLTGKLFYDYINRDDKDIFYLHLKKIFKTKKQQTCVIRLAGNDGTEFYGLLQSSFAESFDSDKICFTSVIDITQLKQTKNELRESTGALEMLRDIAFMANETQSIEKAIEFCLRRISEHNGWSLGHAFIWDDSAGELVAVDSWYASAPERFKQFRKLTMTLRLDRGQGLPGRVLAKGKAEWTADLEKDLTDRRMEMAEHLGVNTAAAFPIIIGEKAVGVLEFFSDDEIIPDERILKAMASVGTLLGRVIERKRAEQRLIEQQYFVQSIADSTPDILYVNDLMAKRNIFVNKQLKNILGYKREDMWDLQLEEIERFIHPEDVRTISRHLGKIAQAQDSEIIEAEYRIKNKKGEWRSLRSRAMVFKRNDDGSVRQYIGIAQDITERKDAREALRKSNEELRRLTAHLDSVREEERKRISLDIHDQLGQALTAIQMDVSWLSNHLPKGQKLLHEKTKSMSKLIQMTSEAVKEIAMKLRPSVLDDLGLVEALKWEAKKFQIRTGIQCKAISNVDTVALDSELSTNIFRVFQEALTNVSRHSGATKVSVHLKKDPDKVQIKMEDNGKGIAQKQIYSSDSIGLIGMKERLHRWGGRVEIGAKPGSGTIVEITVPLKEKLKVLIADDHQIVRQGLKQILSEIPDIEVADEAVDGYEVLSKVWKNDYDVLLLDLSMPGRSGLEVLEQLRSEKPGLPILILSVHSEELYAVRALKAGAFGYLTKESAQDELVVAIRKVAAGKKYITANMAEQIASEMANAEKPLHEKLSNREYQVMELISSGKTVKEIANSLSLSVSTVHTCRTRMLNKMGMKNDREVIRYAIKHGIVK